MAVKRSRSATRMLAVFESIAANQPIGVSALARTLEADKSAVQRDLMTLRDAGWIRALAGSAGQWELSPRILTLARPPHSNESLRLQARPVLEDLRETTGETAYLAVPDGERFVVLTAAESHHPLRVVPAVGIVIPLEGSATGRALQPYLGDTPGPHAAETLRRGFAVNDEEVVAGAVALASAVLGADGSPAGALVLTGPADRLPPERLEPMGQALCGAARRLSAALA